MSDVNKQEAGGVLAAMGKNPNIPITVVAVLWVLMQLGYIGPQAQALQAQTNEKLSAIVVELRTLNGRLDRLEGQFAEYQREGWLLRDQRAWSETLQARNPDLKVPEPKK